MQHRPVFGDVDFVAPEHRIDPASQACFFCQFQQQFQGLARNAIFRIVEKDARRLRRHTAAAIRIGFEELAQMLLAHLAGVRFQIFPCLALC